MKCDELKAYRNLGVAFNTARQTETVIAEDYEGYCIEFEESNEVYLKDEVDAAIAELKQKLEAAQATAYAESVDAGMRERKLKRALWIARAERAKDRKYKYETWERNEMKKFNWDGGLIAIVSMKARKWRRVEIKCIKKADEYK